MNPQAVLMLAGAAAGMQASTPQQGAPASLTCEFAVAGWIASQAELSDARGGLRACLRERRNACTAQRGRVATIEQRLQLLRNYVQSYCTR